MTRLLDLLERTGWTAVQGFLAAWIVLDGDLWSETSLKLAGTAAALAAAKCVVAFQFGSSNTAATLPAGLDTDLGGQ